MKVLLQRTDNVTDGALVELSANNIVTLRSTSAPLGVASNCRSVSIQDSPSSEPVTHLVCDVTIDGDCLALLSGNAPALGGKLYATSNGRLSATVSGDSVALLAPRAYPSISDYTDNELVSVVICGEE